MYCDFYHLNEKPFNITPDPKFLYLNARYREALATLHYGITERKGFLTLIGEAGTGKTTLLNKLLDQLDEKTKTVFIFNTNVTFEEILEYIFAEFDLPVHSGKKLYMLQRLNAFLLEELRGGRNVAVLIDEAQDLDVSVLENLRLLSNLETAKEKILQIVLSGQPELEAKLSSPELRQLRQRIAVNCRLTPLTREELGEYIEFRLHAAGCADAKMFTREAEEQVWHFSQGIPRLVNVVCDNALVIGYALGKKHVGPDVVREASADLIATLTPAPALSAGGVTAPLAEPPPVYAAPARRRGAWALLALVALALVVGFVSMGRRMLPRAVERVAQPAGPSQRTILHPGEDVADVPPAQVGGADHPNAMRRQEQPLVAPQQEPREERLAEPRPAMDAPPPQAGAIAPAAAGSDPAPEDPPQAAPERVAAPVAPAPVAAAPIAVAAVNPPVAPVAPQPAEVAAIDPHTVGGARGAGTAEIRQIPEDLEAPAAVAPEGEELEPEAEVPAKAARGAMRLTGAEFDRIKVRDGDSFAAIAVRKYGQSSYTILDLLKLANPAVEDIDRIATGQTLDLPRLSQGFPIVQQDRRGYGILAYSTPVSSRAAALSKALRARGFAADVSTGNISPGRTVQRVIIGPYASEAEAAGASKEVQRAFREDEKLAAMGRS